MQSSRGRANCSLLELGYTAARIDGFERNAHAAAGVAVTHDLHGRGIDFFGSVLRLERKQHVVVVLGVFRAMNELITLHGAVLREQHFVDGPVM